MFDVWNVLKQHNHRKDTPDRWENRSSCWRHRRYAQAEGLRLHGFILVNSRILSDVTPDEKVASSSTHEIVDCLRSLILSSLTKQNFRRISCKFMTLVQGENDSPSKAVKRPYKSTTRLQQHITALPSTIHHPGEREATNIFLSPQQTRRK